MEKNIEVMLEDLFQIPSGQGEEIRRVEDTSAASRRVCAPEAVSSEYPQLSRTT